jgi:hypothetical protein
MIAQLESLALRKCFNLLKNAPPLDAEWAGANNCNLPLFMVAASCENCAPVSVIYFFLRRKTKYKDDGSNIQNKKRKLGGN